MWSPFLWFCSCSSCLLSLFLFLFILIAIVIEATSAYRYCEVTSTKSPAVFLGCLPSIMQSTSTVSLGIPKGTLPVLLIKWSLLQWGTHHVLLLLSRTRSYIQGPKLEETIDNNAHFWTYNVSFWCSQSPNALTSSDVTFQHLEQGNWVPPIHGFCKNSFFC